MVHALSFTALTPVLLLLAAPAFTAPRPQDDESSSSSLTSSSSSSPTSSLTSSASVSGTAAQTTDGSSVYFVALEDNIRIDSIPQGDRGTWGGSHGGQWDLTFDKTHTAETFKVEWYPVSYAPTGMFGNPNFAPASLTGTPTKQAECTIKVTATAQAVYSPLFIYEELLLTATTTNSVSTGGSTGSSTASSTATSAPTSSGTSTSATSALASESSNPAKRDQESVSSQSSVSSAASSPSVSHSALPTADFSCREL